MKDLVGSDVLLSRFGAYPSFHDAEVVEVHLSRDSKSWLKIRTDLIQQGNQIVTINLSSIQDIELLGFNHQNVLFDLDFIKCAEGFKIELSTSHGLCGHILAKEISVE